MKFQMELTRLIKVLMPFAETIACLESSQPTAADVYLFWLTIMSTLKRLFEATNLTSPDPPARIETRQPSTNKRNRRNVSRMR